MNTVTKITLDLQTDHQPFAHSLYGSWDSFFTRSIERTVDEILAHYDQPGEHLAVELLRLDLGVIEEEKFYEDFPRLLREKLDEALSQLEHSVRSGEVQAVKATLTEDAYTLLTLFLLHGRIDPVQLGKYGNLNALFLLVVRQSGKRFTAFLRTYGHYTGLQERIVRQFDEESLETGVRLLQPGGGTFICSYIRFLHKRYPQLERPAVSRGDYRYAVWSVVYGYLLSNRSSYFNRKSFLIQTLVALAARLNRTFGYLTALLADEIPESPDESAALPELLALLREINRENWRKEMHRAAFDPKSFYRFLGEAWKQEVVTRTGPEIAHSLLEILSRKESCRAFIGLLKEEEVIRLVPLVVPEEHLFVTAYARELERHKEKGAFEGRAGGEFSKLKWFVIFPILLENQGSAFNRKSFIRQVLKELVAHYNLSWKGILLFLTGKTYIHLLGRELGEIFRSLVAELERSTAPKEHKQYRDTIEKAVVLIGQSKPNAATGEQRQFLQEILSNEWSRKELLERITEQEREKLLTLLIPKEKEYILTYSRSLIASVGRHSEISGKTAGGFDRLVWFFIFGLLAEKTTNRFNRRAFARRTLTGLSSHYNLSYADLLTLLYRYSESTRLPEVIAGVIHELYDEERQVWLTHALSVPGEKAKEKLVQQLSPEAADFAPEFFRLLEWLFRSGNGYPASTSDLNGVPEWQTFLPRFQNDKWEWLFQWIFTNSRPVFEAKAFVQEMLLLISRHYRINRTLLEQGVRRALKQMPGKWSSGVATTIYRLFPAREEQNNPPDLPVPATFTHPSALPDIPREAIFVENAGIVLLTPFLPRLFDLFQLIEKGDFPNEACRIRAIFLMQYAVYGKERTTFGEHELFLNKVLTGFPNRKSAPVSCETTEEECETATSLIQSALQHWKKLNNTSIAAFREAFLRREGKCEEKEGMFLLTVEEKAYDLLLDSIPWNFRTVKFPWMEKYIEVRWR